MSDLRALDSKKLSMWVIYDHPREYPGSFVARRFEGAVAGPVSTEDVLLADDPDFLRATLLGYGLMLIHHNPTDDPSVVETWL
jgi:hypothetical protein